MSLTFHQFRTTLYECMKKLHRLVLKQSGHLKLAGHYPSSYPTATGQVSDDPSSLESFNLLMEGVVSAERELGGHNIPSGFAGEFSLPYVGPLTFHRLLDTFCSIYSCKKREREEETGRLKKGLLSLGRTAEEVSSIRESLCVLEDQERGVCQEFSHVLQQLTEKSCQVCDLHTPCVSDL